MRFYSVVTQWPQDSILSKSKCLRLYELLHGRFRHTHDIEYNQLCDRHECYGMMSKKKVQKWWQDPHLSIPYMDYCIFACTNDGLV